MACRVKIGSYIVDADGNSSSTAGVTLLPDSSQGLDGTPMGWRWEIEQQHARAIFNCHVSAATVSELVTAREALESAVLDPSYADVVLESDDNVTLKLFSLASGLYTEVRGAVTVYDGELDCIVECSIIFTRAQPSAGSESAGSAMSPDGLVGAIQAIAARAPGGLLQLTLGADFRDTSGSSAKNNAYAWIDKVRDRNGTVAWLDTDDSTDLRVFSDDVGFSVGSSSAALAGRARATIVLRQFPADLASLAAWQLPGIRDIVYNIDVQPRQMHANAGSPGHSLTVTGIIQAKIEGLALYDANDSDPADLSDAQFVAAIDALKGVVKTRLGGIEIRPLGLRRGRAVHGEIAFTLSGISTDVVLWEEDVHFNDDATNSIVADTSGKEWNYVGGLARIESVTHTLRVIRFAMPESYRTPDELKDWLRQRGGVSKERSFRVITAELSGTPISLHETYYQVTYRKVNT